MVGVQVIFFCINQMAQKVHEATNFAFIHLTDQGPSLYEKSHSNYTQRDKVDLAWERISHDIREHGIFWSKLHRFTKESWLIKATKIICYELCCWQVIMWVFILHNDQLQLTDINALRWSCSCRSSEIINQISSHDTNGSDCSTWYCIEDVGQMTWILVIYAWRNTWSTKPRQTWQIKYHFSILLHF